MRNMAIRHKLILIIMLTCIFALLLAGTAFIVWQWTSLRRHMVRDLSTSTKIIADNCKAALTFEDTKDAEEALQSLHVQPSIVYAGIHDSSDEDFAHYYRYDVDKSIHPSEFQEEGYIFGDGYLTVFERIILDGEVIGTVCIRSDLQPMYVMLRHNIETVIVVLSLASLLAYFVSSRVQRVISGPILKLAESATRIGKGELSYRVKIQSKDELGHLAQSFNDMTAKLEESHRHLEEKVQERTSELTSANEKLEAEIAERKRAEERLKQAAEEWATTFNSITDLVSIHDKDFKLVRANEAFADTFKMKPEELIGKTCYEIVHGTKEPPAECPHKQTLDTKEPHRAEFFDARLGVYLEVSVSPIFDEKGEVIGSVHIAKDITKRKQAEERQAKLLEEVESINQELKDFAYVISHDLKAPLRGIGILSEWLSTESADKLDEEGREQMNLLLSRVGRMSNLIDGVLQYSRVGRVKEEVVRVNLNELIKEVVIDMVAPPENIEITVENELPVIECEETRIIQVFENLLSNAVKFMDKPQGQVKIGCVEEDGFWKFSVSDNGPGIEEKHFERIFQMFQTLSSRDEFESTGVGLTVVKKIVKLYGGKIWVESKPGEGSTFFFTLSKQEMGVKDAKLEANIAR